MSDTPETDALISVGLENADRECVPADFARKLEQERGEAREEAHRFRALHYNHLGINGSASWFPWEGK